MARDPVGDLEDFSDFRNEQWTPAGSIGLKCTESTNFFLCFILRTVRGQGIFSKTVPPGRCGRIRLRIRQQKDKKNLAFFPAKFGL